MTERKLLYSDFYFGLWSDGELAISDGMGYVGSLTEDETKELYLALKGYFEFEGEKTSENTH